MRKHNISFQNIKEETGWTLFLDRDGVINRRLVDDYVKRWEDFEFLPYVLESLKEFNKLFKHIFIVTNQQGIGKGLMTSQALDEIHKRMLTEIEINGGRIDKVFYCPDLSTSNSINRKPNIGMGLKAKKLYPDIRFRESIIIGDSLSDMKFGRKLGMKTVLIPNSIDIIRKYPSFIDYSFPTMKELIEYFE